MMHLPAEVLFTVFDLLDLNSLRTCTTVCKVWRGPSQDKLYRKTSFSNETNLENFVENLKNNNQLSVLVKEIQLNFPLPLTDPYQQTTFVELLNCVPNLEVLESNCRIDYRSILSALSDLKLPRLRSISASPLVQKDFNTYNSCTTLIKNQLENLVLTDRQTIGTNMKQRNNYLINKEVAKKSKGRVFFDRLYNNLHQYPQLKMIFLTTYAKDPIGILESVTEKCPKLETLQLDLGYDYYSPIKTLDHSVVPRPNIKSLNASELQFNNAELLSYIMQKYPQLRELRLATSYINTLPVLQKVTAKQFIDYLLNIDNVKLHGLCVNVDDVVDIFQSFCNHSSYPALKNISISFINAQHDMAVFNLQNGNKTNENSIFINYPTQRGNILEHTKIIEEFGKHFEVVTMLLDQSLFPGIARLPYNMIYGNYIDHILCQCTNLKRLTIKSHELIDINFTNFYLLNRKLSLEVLAILESNVGNGIFEELSTVFESLDNLDLHNNNYGVQGKYSMIPDINMINTTIQELTIFNEKEQWRCVYIKIFLPAFGGYRYYKYNFETENDTILKPCSKDECEDNDFIHIRCQCLFRLVIRSNGHFACIAFFNKLFDFLYKKLYIDHPTKSTK